MATRSMDFLSKKTLMLLPTVTDEQAEEAAAKILTLEYLAWCKLHGIAVVDDVPPVILVTRVQQVLGMFSAEAYKHVEVTDE